MITLMRISGKEIKIKGSFYVVSGQSFIRLDDDGDMTASGFYDHLSAYDNTETVNDSYQLDDNQTFDDNEPFEDFFAYLFGIDQSQITPNRVMFSGPNIIANNIQENQDLDGGS